MANEAPNEADERQPLLSPPSPRRLSSAENATIKDSIEGEAAAEEDDDKRSAVSFGLVKFVVAIIGK